MMTLLALVVIRLKPLVMSNSKIAVNINGTSRQFNSNTVQTILIGVFKGSNYAPVLYVLARCQPEIAKTAQGRPVGDSSTHEHRQRQLHSMISVGYSLFEFPKATLIDRRLHPINS
jgi:hypothetical protein